MKTNGRTTTATVLGAILSLGLVFSANPAIAVEADAEGISALEPQTTEMMDVEADAEGISATGMIAPDGTVVPEGMSIEEFEAMQQEAAPAAPAAQAPAAQAPQTAPAAQGPSKATSGKASELPEQLLEQLIA